MIKWFVIALIFVFNVSYARGIWQERDKGDVVYTNVTENLFFARAFRNSFGNRKEIISLVERMAKRYGVDVRLAKTIAKIESDFNPHAVSKAGAKGIMQLMEKTAKSYGVKNLDSVEENVKGGILFLKHLIKKYHGNLELVAAAYNAGETNVDRYRGVPPFRETIAYVNKFMRLYSGQKHKPARNCTHTRRIFVRNGVYTNVESSLW